MRFRPCIDLHEGVVKQIVGGTLKDASSDVVTNFVASKPAEDFARLYAADKLPGGHVIMLGSHDSNVAAATAALAAYPGGLQIGGGITPANAGAFLAAGASHVIVTSYVFREGRIDWGRLREMEAAVGRERLVLDLSCRKRRRPAAAVTDGDAMDASASSAATGSAEDAPELDAAGCGSGAASPAGAAEPHSAAAGASAGASATSASTSAAALATASSPAAAGSAPGGFEYVVVTDRWQRFTDCVVSPETLATLAAHCAEFLVHGVDVEGLRAGIEDELVALLGRHSPIPVTYAGGVRDMGDVERVRALGCGRVDVSIGSALDIFGGSLPYSEVVAWSRAQA